MIEYYPKHVTANLRKMTKLGGTVPPKGYEGKKWGLRDSYNMQTKRWDHRYLSLDQGMLFLSLANYLHGGVARNIYGRDPQVKQGLKLLKPLYANQSHSSRPMATTGRKIWTAETSHTASIKTRRASRAVISSQVE